MAKRRFPTYSQAARTGDKGVRIVENIVIDKLKWIFKEQEAQKDLGIDAHIELLGDDGAALGRLIAAQIKCGKSFFKNRADDGFVFYGHIKHLNYFLNYSLPVILILCDPDTSNSWWCEVNPLETEQTKAAWRMIVPYGQQFDESARGSLLELAGLSQDYLPALEHYWSANKLLLQPFGLFHIVIAREDIEAGNIGRVLEIFSRFLATSKLMIKNRELLDFSVDGYNDDPRELYEIPQIRKWFEDLNEHFPYWFYFLSKRAKSLRLLATCLCSFEKASQGISLNSADLLRFIQNSFVGMNEICETIGMSELEIRRLSDDAMSYFYPDYSPEKVDAFIAQRNTSEPSGNALT